MCQKAMASGAGAAEPAPVKKKMLGAGAAPKQAGSETLIVPVPLEMCLNLEAFLHPSILQTDCSKYLI